MEQVRRLASGDERRPPYVAGCGFFRKETDHPGAEAGATCLVQPFRMKRGGCRGDALAQSTGLREERSHSDHSVCHEPDGDKQRKPDSNRPVNSTVARITIHRTHLVPSSTAPNLAEFACSPACVHPGWHADGLLEQIGPQHEGGGGGTAQSPRARGWRPRPPAPAPSFPRRRCVRLQNHLGTARLRRWSSAKWPCGVCFQLRGPAPGSP